MGEVYMNDEVEKVLKMVDERKISYDQGAKLIASINKSKKEETSIYDFHKESADKQFYGEKMLKINILSSKGDKINLILPIKVVKIILKSKSKINKLNVKDSKGVDSEAIKELIITAIKKGTEGKIVDLKTPQGDIIEIIIE